MTGFTKSLPSGETETGTWATAGPPANQCYEHKPGGETCAESDAVFGLGFLYHRVREASSFNIPLAEPPATANVVGEEEGEKEPHEKLPPGCKGNASKPEAAPGNLCVFITSDENVTEVIPDDLLTTAGFVMSIKRGSEEEGYEADGTWAVTAK